MTANGKKGQNAGGLEPTEGKQSLSVPVGLSPRTTDQRDMGIEHMNVIINGYDHQY